MAIATSNSSSTPSEATRNLKSFVQALLNDVQALEHMLQNDWFENDIVRIGSEQELCIIDAQTMKPAPINGSILKKMTTQGWIQSELAKFNLEINMQPRVFFWDSLRLMEDECKGYLSEVRRVAAAFNTDVLMTGILPTLHPRDVGMHNLTANERYLPLLETTKAQLQGKPFTFHIRGIDELLMESHSALFPGCNTSFQVHLQVSAPEFTKLYNIAQAITPFILALSANSPLAFGKRLWHETRMLLYPQGSDTRLPKEHLRKYRPRASFGTDWLNGSILDLYKDEISRYSILLSKPMEEHSLELVHNGTTPQLKALQLHNSTVYRWNRPRYGVSPNGQPHLRIENRVISSGPTVVDEMANAAFWLGLMVGLADEVEDIRTRTSFAAVKENFERAAKFGIESELIGWHGKSESASTLILKTLLPIAQKGLEQQGIVKTDIDRYLTIIEERAAARANGATWMLRTYNDLTQKMPTTKALSTLTTIMLDYQKGEAPAHTWGMPALIHSFKETELLIEEVMQTDLIVVVDEDDLILAREIMTWNELSDIAVENKAGRYVGVLSTVNIPTTDKNITELLVKDLVNVAHPIAAPTITLREARALMAAQSVDFLPIVQGDQLVGSISRGELEEY